ncbi:hypothetical protein AA984_04185 [Brevibacillus formosus]|uniref:Uncharacterized protein n=1 Tax=Brevibacillus formosus TaxID=54913 RepID=A0A837KTI8_9BACL|nr:hypothetical protein AA984_04185 [Brevibacillus formosus]PSK00201.1 hypothetical protein C7R91_00790 [Brevibacillus formosus]
MPASKIVLAPFPGYSLFDCGTGVRQGSRGNKRHTMKKALQERKRHFWSKADQLHDLFCDKLFVLSIQEKIDKRIGIIKFLWDQQVLACHLLLFVNVRHTPF